MFSIGVDIGGSHIAACAFNHENKELVKGTLTYKKVNPHGSKNEILNTWVNALQECIDILNKPIEGVGLAMPGPFDYYNGISKISDVEKLQALYDVNLRLELAERLELTPSHVRFINDASAFSIAEALTGAASSYERIVGITLGTGLGASFIINGKPIIKDKLVPDGGFLYNQYYQNVLADELFSTRGITKAYAKKTGNQINNVKAIYAQVENDDQARAVFAEFGKTLGDFIAPYLIDFKAEALVLGGNISKAFDFFGVELRDELKGIDKIYVSQYGEEAAIIGSALLLDEDYYHEIEETLRLM